MHSGDLEVWQVDPDRNGFNFFSPTVGPIDPWQAGFDRDVGRLRHSLRTLRFAPPDHPPVQFASRISVHRQVFAAAASRLSRHFIEVPLAGAGGRRLGPHTY